MSNHRKAKFTANKIIALSLGLVLSSPYCLAASGNTVNGLTPANMSRLADFEEEIYGAARKNLSNDARLDELELKLLGSTKSGSDTVRLEQIASLMPSTRAGSTALVPRAPSLDSLPVQAAPFRDNPQQELQDKNSEALANALSLYSSGHTAEAQKGLSDILNGDPNNFDALYNLGVISESAGNFDQALYYYKRAQAVNGKDSEVNKAVLALSRKAADTQKTLSDKAQQQKQARLKQMVQEASAMYQAKNFDGAISRLTAVAYEAPRDADVQFALAQAYRGKGDINGARHFMAQALALNPQNQSYANAMRELQNAPAVASGAPAVAPSYRGNQIASSSNAATAGGQITPFAGSKADEYAASGGQSGYASTSSYLGAGSTRLKRAVTYGVAGAAGAALFSAFAPSYNGRSRSYNMGSAALKGGLLGSFLGLTFGR
ncbi:MAG: tetratricopeptide repeat protein [Candidatus Obscuribacter sp.]|nr:tetratricopeptide repeat protein [Candidatus Obscuribacter sp.]MBK9769942.1 tetratricopeptide repeat protein [Candidatus Obscuribacter sp.]MBL0184174.1 tetratricopeptide repeat protein [Candidatus Obscuribacter sp.]MBP6350349.1 tetratricopeptide repeat protein [Candidatus Obscuribacter sp.]MBP6592962.1 tetratricopeptide repeat protein [Candidatus Obscuribacter sp.]